jgi:hypothetical protein
MTLFRGRADKVRIMAIGRWYSYALLNYLQPNAPHWSEDLSTLMAEETTSTSLEQLNKSRECTTSKKTPLTMDIHTNERDPSPAV